jgi:hypothetical protein
MLFNIKMDEIDGLSVNLNKCVVKKISWKTGGMKR